MKGVGKGGGVSRMRIRLINDVQQVGVSGRTGLMVAGDCRVPWPDTGLAMSVRFYSYFCGQ